MTKFTIMPTFNLNDPEQCFDSIDAAKRFGEDFLAKYGGPDCRSITVVEITQVGILEHVAPIWIPHAKEKQN